MTTEETRADEDCAITARGLLRLAEEAKRCGIPRYAEAYRLVAVRLQELHGEGLLHTIESNENVAAQVRQQTANEIARKLIEWEWCACGAPEHDYSPGCCTDQICSHWLANEIECEYKVQP